MWCITRLHGVDISKRPEAAFLFYSAFYVIVAHIMNGEEKEQAETQEVESARFAEEVPKEDLDSVDIAVENLPV